jgi:hypothetical protein
MARAQPVPAYFGGKSFANDAYPFVFEVGNEQQSCSGWVAKGALSLSELHFFQDLRGAVVKLHFLG